MRDDERATHVIEEEKESDVSTDSSVEDRMRDEPHNFSDVTTDSSDSYETRTERARIKDICKEPKREKKRYQKKEAKIVFGVMKRAVKNAFELWWYAMKGFVSTGDADRDDGIKKKILEKYTKNRNLNQSR